MISAVLALALGGGVASVGYAESVTKLERPFVPYPTKLSDVFVSECIPIPDHAPKYHHRAPVNQPFSDILEGNFLLGDSCLKLVFAMGKIGATIPSAFDIRGNWKILAQLLPVSVSKEANLEVTLDLISRCQTSIDVFDGSSNFAIDKQGFPEGSFRHTNIGSQLMLSSVARNIIGLFRSIESRPNEENADRAQSHPDHGSECHNVSPQGGLSLGYKIAFVALVIAGFVACLLRAIVLLGNGKVETGLPYLVAGIFGIMASVGVGLPLIFGAF